MILGVQHADTKAAPSQQDPTKAIAHTSKNVTATGKKQSDYLERPNKKAKPCQSEEDDRYSELCAQWKAADAAASSAWWAGAATWVSGISGLLVVVAVGLAYQANAIARTTAKQQLRAYLEINNGRVKFLREPPKSRVLLGGMRIDDPIEVEFFIDNTGQTPAYDIFLKYDYILWSPTGVFGKEQAISSSKSVKIIGKSFSVRNRLSVSSDIWHSEIAPGIAVTAMGTITYKDCFGVEYTEQFGIGYWPHVNSPINSQRGDPSFYDPWLPNEWMAMNEVGTGGNYV